MSIYMLSFNGKLPLRRRLANVPGNYQAFRSHGYTRRKSLRRSIKESMNSNIVFKRYAVTLHLSDFSVGVTRKPKL